MGKKPKDVAALIVAGGPKDGAHSTDMANDGGDDSQGNEMDAGQMAAAEEAMHALKANDSKGFAEALKAFIEMSV